MRTSCSAGRPRRTGSTRPPRGCGESKRSADHLAFQWHTSAETHAAFLTTLTSTELKEATLALISASLRSDSPATPTAGGSDSRKRAPRRQDMVRLGFRILWELRESDRARHWVGVQAPSPPEEDQLLMELLMETGDAACWVRAYATLLRREPNAAAKSWLRVCAKVTSDFAGGDVGFWRGVTRDPAAAHARSRDPFLAPSRRRGGAPAKIGSFFRTDPSPALAGHLRKRSGPNLGRRSQRRWNGVRVAAAKCRRSALTHAVDLECARFDQRWAEQGVSGGLPLGWHAAHMQGSCINMQWAFMASGYPAIYTTARCSVASARSQTG